MHWSEVTKRPTDRQLREFAAVGALVCSALAVWHVWSGNLVLAGVLSAVLLSTIAAGIFRPRWLAPVFTAAMIVAFPIAWTVSLLVLAAVFYGLLTPVGLLFRLIGRNTLDRHSDPKQDSYWQEKPAAENPRRYLRQF